MERHAAQAPAKRTAFVDLKIGPDPNSEIFGHGIAVAPDDFECISVLRDKTLDPCGLQVGQNVGGLEGKPLATDVRACIFAVKRFLCSGIVRRFDPAN